MDDDPFIATLAFDRLETFSDHGANALDWELHGWAGHRRDCFEWRSRGERVAGEPRDGELELLWSHATGPWNRTLGVRHDFGVDGDRDWLALGVEGIAPLPGRRRREPCTPAKAAWARASGQLRPAARQRLVPQPRLEASGYAGHDAPRDRSRPGCCAYMNSAASSRPTWATTGPRATAAALVAGIRAWF